jgi:hypothetical protein
MTIKKPHDTVGYTHEEAVLAVYNVLMAHAVQNDLVPAAAAVPVQAVEAEAANSDATSEAHSRERPVRDASDSD